MEGFSELVSDFIAANTNFLLNLLHNMAGKNCENHQRSTKSTEFILRFSKKNSHFVTLSL
jgi:hypothetical protein